MLKAIALVALSLSLEGGFILHSVVSFVPVPAARAVSAEVAAASALPAAPDGALGRAAVAVAR
jgi:hypothetical protein